MKKKRNKENLPDITLHLDPQEWHPLVGKPDYLWRFYLFLSCRRDTATNLAGLHAKINLQAVQEWMEIHNAQGLHDKYKRAHIDVRTVDRWIKSLEELGLIEPQGNYVFLLKKAKLGETGPKYDADILRKNNAHDAEMMRKNFDEKISDNILINKDKLEVGKSDGADMMRKNNGHDADMMSSPQNTLHNITLHSENQKKTVQPFRDLLIERGYYLNHMQHKKTHAMLEAWYNEGVTPEEAKIGMEHTDAQLGKRPDTPWYYLRPVLQVKQDFLNAKKASKEVSNAERKSASQNHRARGKSNTESFYDDCFDNLIGAAVRGED